jgi:hypothetical protein
MQRRRESPVWYHELEDELVPVAYEAARKICDHVHHAELRLENGGVYVIVERRPTEPEYISVASAVKRALTGRVADPERLKILVRRGSRLMYTSYLRSASQAPKHLASLLSATRFTIRLSEIIGLRNIYDELVRLAYEHDFVATTALGGVPGLLHLLEYAEKNDKPEDYADWASFYDNLRGKYHLFPGLLWSETDREADSLYDWMKSLPVNSSLLLFDTGSVGNGARRFLKVVKDRCAGESSLGLGRITILGVVDGQHASQKAEDTILTHATGQTRMVLSYHHVPRMLSEDCQELLGFESVRREMMYRSANASAVIEVVSDLGEHIQSLAAMSGASAVRRLIREHSFPEPGNQEDAEATTRFLSGLILCNGVRQVWRMLQNAVEFGLIDQDNARAEAEAAQRTAQATFERDLIPHWDFVAKKKTRRKN